MQRRMVLSGRAADGLAETGPVICACFGVGLNVIREAIASNSATDVEAIGKALRAGTNCGSCLPELKRIVHEHAHASLRRGRRAWRRWRACRCSMRSTGKRAVVAGGSAAAAWKAELLAAAGAAVDVYAAEPSEEMIEIAGAGRRHDPSPRDRRRPISPAPRWRSARSRTTRKPPHSPRMARSAGVPVNVIDKPAFCDFAFGSIVNRSPLVIGISTDGAAPVFGQAIRAKLEALIPRGFARWAEAARQWRPRVQALALSFRERRRFWERFTERAVAEPDRAPAPSDIDALMGETRGAAREPPARSCWSAPARAIRNCSRCARCARCSPPT